MTGPHDLWSAWSSEPGVVIPLALVLILYLRGLEAVRGVRAWEVYSFCFGWLVLAIALVSPLDALGRVLFSAHIVQKIVLMAVAAPLLVLGRPLAPLLAGLPVAWRPTSVRWFQTALRFLANPFVAWSLYAVMLWTWQAPRLMLLISAVLFWWCVARVDRERMGFGAALLYVFAAFVQTSILGALLMFSTSPWYPAYSIEDQQLGGLILLVTAGLAYLIAGAMIAGAWIRESEWRVLHGEREVDL
jgi:putative membrane protein